MTGGATLLCGGILLFCAFLVLAQPRPAALIKLTQIEALALAAASFSQGFARGDPALYLTGSIILSIQMILLPVALRRMVQRRNPVAAAAVLPAGISMILGGALIGVATLATPPGREDLVVGLAVMLLGLLAMTARGDALGQVIGFVSAENGLILTAVLVPGLPFVAAIEIALLVPAALMLAGAIWLGTRTCDPAGRRLR